MFLFVRFLFSYRCQCWPASKKEPVLDFLFLFLSVFSNTSYWKKCMYRYKSLEGEYFCNKDFAKKYASLPMTWALMCFHLASSPPLSSLHADCWHLVCSKYQKVCQKAGLRHMCEISVDCEDPAQQREVTIFLGCILKQTLSCFTEYVCLESGWADGVVVVWITCYLLSLIFEDVTSNLHSLHNMKS